MEILHNDILVVEIWTSTLAFVFATSWEDTTGWSIMWTMYDFTKESYLSCRNHVDGTWNVVEQAANLVILDALFLNLCNGDVENSVDTAV